MTGMATALNWIAAALEPRLSAAGRDFQQRARDEIRAGCEVTRFCGLISLASRYVPTSPLAPSREELAAAEVALAGWNPERWTLRETSRVDLVLSRPDLAEEQGRAAVEAAFAFADMGELCALYRSLVHMPDPKRFASRAAEGARTNIRAVFEAALCDTPFPVRYFDDVAWRQCVIKALFIEAPLWRVVGLDTRIDQELARMALDLAEERRSAGRHVNPQLWLCLGSFGGERGLRALLGELEVGTAQGRAAAALALGRLDPASRARTALDKLLVQEKDPVVQEALRQASSGAVTSFAFRSFDGPVPKVV